MICGFLVRNSGKPSDYTTMLSPYELRAAMTLAIIAKTAGANQKVVIVNDEAVDASQPRRMTFDGTSGAGCDGT